MAIKGCPKHPNYKALRAPMKTRSNPDGCPTCWDFFRERKHAAELELAGKTKKRGTPITRANTIKSMDGKKQMDASRLKVVKDDLSDQYEIMYGTRCLFTADAMSDVDTFLVGLKEGLNFDGIIKNRD